MEIEDYNRLYEERRASYDELRQVYNPDGSTLRKYQLHLAQVLKDFDGFCKEHDITYYMAWGTLLGAVRHHGFIPWDDDADIWMDRSNYRKLTSLMKGEHQELIKDKLYVHMGIRPELWSPPFAYIDIFVLSPSPRNAILRKLKELRVVLLYCLIKTRDRMKSGFRKKSIRFLPFLPIAALHSSEYWRKKRERVMDWLTDEKYTKGTEYLQEYNSDYKGVRFKFPSDPAVWQVCRLEFEDGHLNAPRSFERVLEICFGDFMQVPDADHLHVHGLKEMVEGDFQ